jgi:pimeloyl-[acyl-carrier protein] synthase
VIGADAAVAFDSGLLTPEYLANPYSFYSELRRKAPVYFSERLNGWIVTRYADVSAGLLDKRLISRRRVESFSRRLDPTDQDRMAALQRHLEKWIGNMDPPDHTRLRALVNKAFTPRMVQELAHSIESIASRLLDAAQAKGEMEFVRDFAYPLPATVIATMLGIAAEDQHRFIRWADDLTAYTGSGTASPDLGLAAQRSVDELTMYFRAIATERRIEPRNDLISSLVSLEEEGDRISEQELISMCTFLLVAGHETTMALLANGLHALLQNPAECRMLRHDPELMKTGVEEFLRYDSPIQHQTRVAAEPLTISETPIDEGQRVLLMLGAANRDPAQFPDPDRLDLSREPNRHVAFGLGVHYCLGAPLARIEAQIAFAAILRRFPQIRLQEQSVRWRVHTSNRNPISMKVAW